MGILFFVVTDEGMDAGGNLCDTPLTFDGTDLQVDTDRGLLFGFVKMKVFEKGEVLICDSVSGREIPYPGRKPSKWHISGEFYKDLDAALKRSEAVSFVKEGESLPLPEVQPESVQTVTQQKSRTEELVSRLKSMSKTQIEKLPIYQQIKTFLEGGPQKKAGD